MAAAFFSSPALLFLAASLALAGCGDGTVAPIDPQPVRPDALAPAPQPGATQQGRNSIDRVQLDSCNAAGARPFIGHRADRDTRAALVQAMPPDADLRWVPQNNAIATSHDPRRLRVFLDKNGVITGLRCG